MHKLYHNHTSYRFPRIAFLQVLPPAATEA
jgi:hypothetical protein